MEGEGMENNPTDSDFVVESGRAKGGRMFVRVVHQPTGKNRTIVGLGERSHHEVVDELIAQIKREIEVSSRPS
jgi:hypothetical protein